MSYRCPVCKTPLWKEPFLVRRLKCPRCNAEFRPTVPWVYVRVLLLLIALLGLAMVILALGQNPWLILLFLFAVVGFFWYLSRLVNLEQIAGDLTVPEGPIHSEDLHLDLEDQNQPKRKKPKESRSVSSVVFYGLVLLTVILFFLLFTYFVR